MGEEARGQAGPREACNCRDAPTPAAGRGIAVGGIRLWCGRVAVTWTKGQNHTESRLRCPAHALTWVERTVCFLQALCGQEGSLLCLDTST